MTYPIDNQYRYGVVYNLDGQIVGFNVSPDVFVGLTDDDIEKALETYAKRKLEQEGEGVFHEDKVKALENIREEISHLVFRPYEGRDMLDRQEVLEVFDKYMKESEEE